YDEKLEEREENGGYDPMTGRSVKEPKLEKVTNHTVSNVLSALQSTELVPSHVEQPAWLHSPGDPPFPADEILLCRNALVHLGSIAYGMPHWTCPPTQAFFSGNALDLAVPFDPLDSLPKEWVDATARPKAMEKLLASECPEWLSFL